MWGLESSHTHTLLLAKTRYSWPEFHPSWNILWCRIIPSVTNPYVATVMTHISGLKSYEATFSSSTNSYLTAASFPCFFLNSCHIAHFLVPDNKHRSSLLAHLEGQKSRWVRVQHDQHSWKFMKTALSKKPFDVWLCIQNVTIFLTHIFWECRPGTSTMKLTLMRTELWGKMLLLNFLWLLLQEWGSRQAVFLMELFRAHCYCADATSYVMWKDFYFRSESDVLSFCP